MAARLSLAEREEIACGLAANKSHREIADEIGRHHGTVSREVARGCDRRGRYRASVADRVAGLRAKRPKARRFDDHALTHRVNRQLKERLSPQAIALLCARDGSPVSHETIYREIYRPDSRLHRKAVKWLCRPRPGRKRRRRTSRLYVEPLGAFRSIWKRPKRVGAGHWEGDLLIGSRNKTACVVLCEVGSSKTLVGALPGGQGAEHVTDVIDHLLNAVPTWRRRTLTWDRGRELVRWQDVERRTGIKVYFCDPASPWQKGLVEGTCGLLRRWLPRTGPIPTDQQQLERAVWWINHMPRYKRGGRTAQELYDGVATTT